MGPRPGPPETPGIFTRVAGSGGPHSGLRDGVKFRLFAKDFHTLYILHEYGAANRFRAGDAAVCRGVLLRNVVHTLHIHTNIRFRNGART